MSRARRMLPAKHPAMRSKDSIAALRAVLTDDPDYRPPMSIREELRERRRQRNQRRPHVWVSDADLIMIAEALYWTKSKPRSAPTSSSPTTTPPPPSTPDRIAGDPHLGSNVSGTIDRYAANAGAELARALAGPTPTGPADDVASGDWPLFTSSALDTDVLRWVPWTVRHAAALSTDRSFVM